MLGIVWVALVALTACTAAGVVTLAALPPWLRAVLVPASPAVGVVAVVLPLTWLHVVVPGRVAAVLVWLALVVVGALLVLRARDRLPTARQWRGLAVALGVGVVLALPSLAPSLRAETTWVVQPSPNNDAVWHVGSAEWFLDHRAGDRPDVDPSGNGEEGPFIWPTKLAIDDGMRRGEPLLQGALSVLTGKRPMADWSPITAMWVALLPGAVAAAIRLLGGSRAAAATGALVGASSAVLATQVFWQHGPSVVAMCGPLPLALGLTWLAPRHRSAAVAAALAWAGVVTLYNELVPLYVPTAAVLLLGRLVLSRRRDLVGLALAVGVAVVAAAPTLLQVVGYLRGLAANPTTGGSPYVEGDLLDGLMRVVGMLPIRAPLPDRSIQLAMAVVGGVVVLAIAVVSLPSLLQRRARPLRAAALVLGLTVGVAEVLAIRNGETYSAKRILDTGAPLVFALVAAVLAEGVHLQRARRWIPAVGLTALGLAVSANLVSGWRAGDIPDLEDRVVDADLRATADVARAHDDEGRGLMVAVGSYFDEHWLGLLLVDRPGVAYPLIGPGYAVGARYGSMDGIDEVIIDDEVLAALPGARAIGRFQVADVADRDWSVVQLGLGWYPVESRPDGPHVWMGDRGGLVITGHDLGCATSLALQAVQPSTVTRHIDGLADVVLPAGPDEAVVDLHLPGVPIVDATLIADPPAITGYEGDPRPLSVLAAAAGPPACGAP